MAGLQNKKNEWIPEVEPKPENGLKFRSFHEAYVFYKDYAKKSGFEVHKSTTIKMASGVGYSHKYVVCAKEGKKQRSLCLVLVMRKTVLKTVHRLV